jgi:hypothetical protein
MKGCAVIEPSRPSLDTLAANGASALVIDAAIRMTECLRLAGDDVAESTDDEGLFDDATSRGQLLYRRARNRILDEFADDDAVTVSTDDNALHVVVDGCALSFYSAPNGLEHPSLATTSHTKRGVIDEMQMQLSGEGLEATAPRRLVLMHESDEDGLLRAAVGVLRSRSDWAWSATMYDRITPASDLPDTTSEPSYEEQPEAELPVIERREETAPAKRIDHHSQP